jgi:hypothetical protein
MQPHPRTTVLIFSLVCAVGTFAISLGTGDLIVIALVLLAALILVGPPGVEAIGAALSKLFRSEAPRHRSERSDPDDKSS